MKVLTNLDIITSLRACANDECRKCALEGQYDCHDILIAEAATRMEMLIMANEKINAFCDGRTSNAVEHPKHYNAGSIEVWDAIEDWGLGFLLGNVIKYVVRAGKKGDRLEDLLKAREYINKAIEIEKGDRDHEVAEEQ